MSTPIDTSYEFHSDTPLGKDPDSHSPTLREYHRLLWSKPLPNGEKFALAHDSGGYLASVNSRHTMPLTSDAITTRLRGRARRVIAEVAPADLPQDLGYTVGSAIIFPGNRVGRAPTINGARGLHPQIADRFDLTLECIRRHYRAEASPLSAALARYTSFFELFDDFTGYVEFFLLNDLVDRERDQVLFLHPFASFGDPPVPRTVAEYVSYVTASNGFIRARARRIDAWQRHETL